MAPETQTTLVVEDEQTLRETLAYNPTHVGYRVLDAGGGRTAIAVARREGPDLVLLDLMLPEVDGFAVLRTIGRSCRPPFSSSRRAIARPRWCWAWSLAPTIM